MSEFSHTQDQLSAQLGKSRSHVANTLRLLKLPQSVRTMVQNGALSAGHARAIIGTVNAQEAYMKAIDKGRFAPLLEGTPMGEIAKGGKPKAKH